MSRKHLSKLLGYCYTVLTPSANSCCSSFLSPQSLSLKRLNFYRQVSQSITQFSEHDVGLRRALSPLLRKLDDVSWTQLPSNQRILEKLKIYKEKLVEVEELQSLKLDSCDSKMLKLIEEEQAVNEQNLLEMESEIATLLIPADPADHSNVSIEISAGVGGAEAMLFTRDLFNMYFAYAQYKGWNVEVAMLDETELGGLRKANVLVDGHLAYRQFKFEGGVHRVQRIPKTEKSGRIHTSTVTVAILPQPSEIDVVIHPKDLQMQTFRASGPGGQHVNKTESAVRLIHVPSGIIAECQATRSQLKNRETALKVIRSRLYEQKLQKQTEAIRTQRKIQVGSAGRSEKIRTYNYQQDRITDHRLGSNAHNIAAFLSGGELLDSMITELQQESDRELLTEALTALKSN